MCSKDGQYKRLEVYHIVPREEYFSITDPKYLFNRNSLAYVLNSPKGLENSMINDDRLKFLEKHSRFDRNVVERYYRKKNVDVFIKAVNGNE